MTDWRAEIFGEDAIPAREIPLRARIIMACEEGLGDGRLKVAAALMGIEPKELSICIKKGFFPYHILRRFWRETNCVEPWEAWEKYVS